MSTNPPNLPARRAVAFVYEGHEITFDDAKLVNMTAMWRAVASPQNKDPRQWVRKEGRSFIEDLAGNLNVPVGHIWKSRRGKHLGGTWAHWQIALAYAKYLSHELHRFVNSAFREWAEEKADPDLKASRAIQGYRDRGRNNRWIGLRIEGILKRHEFTDELKDRRVEPEGYGICTNEVYKGALGQTAREAKRSLGLAKSASLRDNLTGFALAKVRFTEEMSVELMRIEDAQGNGECQDACRKAAESTRQAIERSGLPRAG